MEIAFRILIFIIGACIGSFLCCQARRLHYNLSHKKKLREKRSICFHCKKSLKWYDNIPIVSWLFLRGKCRQCHRKIGITEILAELGTATAFLLLSFTVDLIVHSPLEWATFIASMVFASVLIFLAIYDGLYGELPTVFLILSILCAIAVFSLQTWATLSNTHFTVSLVINPVLSVLILGGLYLVLYLASKGKWVGDGDWMLATAIAIVLNHPFLALATLFIANFTACLIMLPVAKGNTKAKVHFGPFLVIAFIVTYSLSSYLIMFIS
jgi:leader peptidase (prepilin peptidase)/N-methyltransferase